MFHDFFEANIKSYHDLPGSELAQFMNIFIKPRECEFSKIGVYFITIIGDIYDNQIGLNSSKEDLDAYIHTINEYVDHKFRYDENGNLNPDWEVHYEYRLIVDDIHFSDKKDCIVVNLKNANGKWKYIISLEVTPENTVKHVNVIYDRLVFSAIVDDTVKSLLEEVGWTFVSDDISL